MMTQLICPSNPSNDVIGLASASENIRQTVDRLDFLETRRMEASPKLQRWEQRTEWPLATVALVFLSAYSVQVIAQPHGHTARILWAVTWTIWGLFVIDYIARLFLAADRPRWF